MKLERKFFHYLKKEQLFEKGDKVLLAFSGGADSVGAFWLLWSVRQVFHLEISLCYVNHGLREDSQDEATFVRMFAHENKVALFETVWEEGKNTTTNVEENAREFRYKFLEQIQREYGFDKTVTAHHGDDLVETILMKLLRGTYLPNLIGIRKERIFSSGKLVRVLLPYSKCELLEYMREKKQMFVEDSTNESEQYFRNRVRKTLLPFIQKENPSYLNRFNHFSKEVSYFNDFTQTLAQVYLKENMRQTKDGFVLKNMKKNTRAQNYIYLSQAFQSIGIADIVLNFEQLEQILDALESPQSPLVIQLEKGRQVKVTTKELEFL